MNRMENNQWRGEVSSLRRPLFKRKTVVKLIPTPKERAAFLKRLNGLCRGDAQKLINWNDAEAELGPERAKIAATMLQGKGLANIDSEGNLRITPQGVCKANQSLWQRMISNTTIVITLLNFIAAVLYFLGQLLGRLTH